MLSYTVSYTSSSEGVTIGVSGDSFVEALSALVEEFGEGVVPLYEHTRSEFIELCKAIDVHVHEEDDETTHVTPPREDVPEPEPPGEGEGDTGDVEGRPDAEEGTVSDGALYVCTVCGIDITRDRAKASQLMLGEHRCSDCTT